MYAVLIYTLEEYLNIYFAYRFILNIKFHKRKWIYIVTLLVVDILQVLAFHKFGKEWIDFIIACTGFIVPIFWTAEKKVKYVFYFPIVYIGTSVVNTLATYLFAILGGMTEFKTINTPFYTLVSETAAIFLMFLIGQWKKKQKKEQEEYKISLKQYIILMIGFLNFIVIIGMAQMLEKIDEFPMSKRRIFGFSEVMVAFLFLVLNIWQMIVLKRERVSQQKNETYEKYICLQEEHIKMLIDRDESLRRFKHDFHAHITALEEHAVEKQDVELQQYLGNMRGSSALYSVQRYTGIAAVDAVISELLAGIESVKIKIHWEGTLPLGERVTVFDLCTIFSNLLSNAIEACELQCGVKREIYVKVFDFEGRTYIDVKNSYTDREQEEEKFQTTKTDKVNHGFGIRNVKDTVKKYHGTVKFKKNQGWFVVEILI